MTVFFSKRMGSNSQNQMSFAFQMIREILRQIALNGLIFHGNHFVGWALKYDQWKWELGKLAGKKTQHEFFFMETKIGKPSFQAPVGCQEGAFLMFIW